MTAARSRAPARSRSPIAAARTCAGVQAGQLGGAQGPPQPTGLVAGLSPVSGWQVGHEQVPVALFAGRGGLGGPDRVQDGQVVGVGQGLLPGLGRGLLLAISVQHSGQHSQRVPGLGRRGGGGLARRVRR